VRPGLNVTCSSITKRHPHEVASADIAAFLTHVAVQQNVAASTQNQALSALLLLSRAVLNTPLDHSLDAARAKKPKRLPTVLTKDETLKGIEHLSATP
jgi:site-specific recombinase XerD